MSLTGERLAPRRPVLAAARVQRAVSHQHVQVITTALRGLPSGLPVEQVAAAERILVPDAQSKRRSLTLTDLPGGMVRVTGTLDAETEGWTITTRDGIPLYTPPRWRDPTQTPNRNLR